MREPGIDGSSVRTTYPTSYGAPSVREQASALCKQFEAITKGGPGNMNEILTQLRALAQIDPQSVAQALRDNPQVAQMLTQALVPQDPTSQPVMQPVPTMLPQPTLLTDLQERYEKTRKLILDNMAR